MLPWSSAAGGLSLLLLLLLLLLLAQAVTQVTLQRTLLALLLVTTRRLQQQQQLMLLSVSRLVPPVLLSLPRLQTLQAARPLHLQAMLLLLECLAAVQQAASRQVPHKAMGFWQQCWAAMLALPVLLHRLLPAKMRFTAVRQVASSKTGNLPLFSSGNSSWRNNSSSKSRSLGRALANAAL
jgi:hypothetical protein